MTAPVAFLPVPRPKTPKNYDQRTVDQSFQSLERDLQQKFDRRGDLILDPGAELVLTADGSSAQYGIGIDVSGYIRILNYADGSIGTFSVAWAQVDGAQQEITNLTTYVDAADATLTASINSVATTSATNGTAISALQTEITAAREGEASLLANITDVRTAFASADAAEASARLTLQANLEAADTTLQANIDAEESARVTADSAEATARTALQAALEGADTTLQANIDSEASTRATADSAAATDRTAIRSEFATADTTLQANIDTEASTRATADTAEAAARTTLEARTESAANFVPNPTGHLGEQHWSQVSLTMTAQTSVYWGQVFTLTSGAWTGFRWVDSDPISIATGNVHTISADLAIFATSGSIYLEAVCRDSGGGTLSQTPSGPVSANTDFTNDHDGRTSVSFTPPSGTADVIIRVVTNSVVSPAYVGFRRVKLEVGSTATHYSPEGESLDVAGATITNAASIVTEESARITADAAEAAARATLQANLESADTTLQSNIDTEASARATADTAEASARETLAARFEGSAGSIIPDAGYRDPSFWNYTGNSVFYDGSGLVSKQNEFRGLLLQDDGAGGVATYDFSSDYFDVIPGATYEITTIIWSGYPGFTGWVRPMIYVPAVQWQDAWATGPANVVSDSSTTATATDMTSASFSGTETYKWTAPTSTTKIQIRTKASITGSTAVWIRYEMRLMPQEAEVSILRDAFVDSSGNAYAAIRLVAAASGGTPAIIELKSGDGTSDVRLGGNTEIDGNLVVNGTIQTLGIVANGITEVSSDSTDAATSLSDNTWTDVASVAVTVAAGETIKLEGSAFFEASYSGGGSGSTNVACDYRLVRDSTVLRTQDATNYVALAGVPGSILSSGRGLAVVMDTDSPGAGSYTYKLQANITLNGVGPSATTRDVSNRLLIVTRLKR